MKIVTLEFHNRKRQVLFWACLLVFILTVAVGPFVATAFVANSTQQIQETKQISQNTQSISNTINKAVNNPSARASRDATVWFVVELREICNTTPHCINATLTPALQALLQQSSIDQQNQQKGSTSNP